MSTTPQELLSRIELFSGLDEEDSRALARVLEPFRLGAGAVLFSQGDACDAMYCVASGRLALTVRVAGERELELGEVGAGVVLGELAVVDGKPRSATARALEETAGYAMPRSALDALRAARSRAATTLVRRLAEVAAERLGATAAAIAASEEKVTPAVGAPTAAKILHPPGERSRRPAEVPPGEVARALPALAALGPAELTELFDGREQLELERGEVLLRPGEPPGSVWLVLEGAIEVRIDRHDGISEQMAILGPGRLVGVLAALGGRARAATCVARESTTVMELPLDEVRALLEGESRLARHFVDAVCQQVVDDLRTANRRKTWMAARESGLIR